MYSNESYGLTATNFLISILGIWVYMNIQKKLAKIKFKSFFEFQITQNIVEKLEL